MHSANSLLVAAIVVLRQTVSVLYSVCSLHGNIALWPSVTKFTVGGRDEVRPQIVNFEARVVTVAYAGILKGPGHYAEGRILIDGAP